MYFPRWFALIPAALSSLKDRRQSRRLKYRRSNAGGFTRPLCSEVSKVCERLEDRTLLSVTGVVAPHVQSIDRLTPAAALTNAPSVDYSVTFSEPVTGVDASDFRLDLSGTVFTAITLVTSATGSQYSSVYTVTVSGVTGDGNLGLNLVDNGSVHDMAGQNLSPVAAFQNQQTYATGSFPMSLAVADFDNDGDSDIVVDNGGGNALGYSLSLLPSNGNGAFQSQVPILVTNAPVSVAVADLNADGNLDIVLGNAPGYANGTLGVLLGNGDGTFQNQQLVATFSRDTFLWSLATGDVNHDGNSDIVVSYDDYDQASGSVGKYLVIGLGNGDGTFQAPQSIATSTSAFAGGPRFDAEPVVVADVNTDGLPDVIVLKPGDNSVGILLGNGDGTFRNQVTFHTGNTPQGVSVADLNGDGKPDLAVSNLDDNSVGVLLGNGDGTFQVQQTFAAGNWPAATAVADINGDGHPDLVVTHNDNTDGLGVLLGEGDGTFQSQRTFNVGRAPVALAVVDVNGDGKADIVTANAVDNTLSVLLNTTGETFKGASYLIDNTPPQLALPPDQVFNTSNPQGAVVNYVGSATATDSVTAAPTITYSVPQNSRLPIGTTLVTVTATDEAGNQMIGTFNIIVQLAAATNSDWAVEFGSSKDDTAQDVAADDAGNVYVTGNSSELGAPVSLYGTWPSISNAYVRKYNASGEEIWDREINSAGHNATFGVAAYGTAVYVVGQTFGALPGQVAAGQSDAFLRKYDSNGTELWTREVGSAATNDYIAYDVIADASGVYVAGRAQNRPFVAKFDSNGTLVWVQSINDPYGVAYHVALDASGVYVSGGTGYGVLPGQSSAGGSDAFVAKYDRNGNAVWTRQFGTSGEESGYGLAVDASGVYVGGVTDGTFPGQASHPSSYSIPYLRKYDATGNEIWTREYDRNANGEGPTSGIAVDASGIYFTGATANHAFVQKSDQNGNEIFALTVNGTAGGSSVANGIVAGPAGLFVAISTQTPLSGRLGYGGVDSILAKVSVPPVVTLTGLPAGLSSVEGATITLSAPPTHLSAGNRIDGAGFIYTWNVTKDGSPFISGSYFSYDSGFHFTPIDNGSYVVSVTAADADGTTGEPAVATITVLNAAPQVAITTRLARDASNTVTAPTGTMLAFSSEVHDSPVDMASLTYSWSVSKDGAPYSLTTGTIMDGSSFSFAPTDVGSYLLTLVVADKDGGVTTATQTINVTGLDATSLQQLVDSQAVRSNVAGIAVNMQTDPTQYSTVIDALNALIAPVVHDYDDGTDVAYPVTITLDLADGNYTDLIVNLQAGVTLTIVGNGSSTVIVGHSPALLVNSGSVVISGVTLTTATDSPTIRVTGGNLVLRDDIVQETTGGTRAALEIVGGVVDLGTTTDLGGNTFQVNGAGELLHNTGPSAVSAIGNTFRNGATVLTSGFAIEDKIFHALDATASGLVTWESGQAFVTSASGSIQRGVDAVASGGTVNVSGSGFAAYTAGAKLVTVAFVGGPTITQRADNLDAAKRMLIVIGTAGADQVSFDPGNGSSQIKLSATGAPSGTFQPTSRLVAYGGDGNDVIQVAGSINLSAWLYGDGGDDLLNAGNASPGGNLLFGGDGNDALQGGSGRDIMIGGQGADKLTGNANDDILIAGLTTFDLRSAPGHDNFWSHVIQKWTDINVEFLDRVYGLRTATGANLLASVMDDSTADQIDMLQGSSGNDWFLFKAGEDKVVGQTEFIN